jgi:hypothetical protein
MAPSPASLHIAVLLMNTEELRSKVTLPSGFGYSIGMLAAAVFSVVWSGCGWCSVQGARPRNSRASTAELASPPNRPHLAKLGRMLRTFCSSSCSQLSRKASS